MTTLSFHLYDKDKAKPQPIEAPLTYVIGPNGSGKTTLLHLLREGTAKQGGFPASHEVDGDLPTKRIFLSPLEMMYHNSLTMDGASEAELEQVKSAIEHFNAQRDPQCTFKLDGTRILVHNKMYNQTSRYLCRSHYWMMHALIMVSHHNSKDTLFLLDIPETSVHIGAIAHFLKTLYIVGRESQFIIATHSPEVITVQFDESNPYEHVSSRSIGAHIIELTGCA